jgi:hypothetical protein
MRVFAGLALAAVAMAIGGCQSTGGVVDPRLTSFCSSSGFGQPGDALYNQCLIDYSMGGRGTDFDPRAAGRIGT